MCNALYESDVYALASLLRFFVGMTPKLPFWPFLLLLCACANEVEHDAAPPAAAVRGGRVTVDIALVDDETGEALAGEEVCLSFIGDCFGTDGDGVAVVEFPESFILLEVPATDAHPVHTMMLPEGVRDVTITMPVMRYDRAERIAAAAGTSWEGRTLVLARAFRGTLGRRSEGTEMRLDAAYEEGPFYLDENGSVDPQAERTSRRGEAVFFAEPREAELPSLAIPLGLLTASLVDDVCYGAWSRFDPVHTISLRPDSVAVSLPMACLHGAR